MPNTPTNTKSFLLAEMPTISARCSHCGAFIKTSINEFDQPVQVEIPYTIRTIEFFHGGRSFEKIDSVYQHNCQSQSELAAFVNQLDDTDLAFLDRTIQETQNSLRGAHVGHAALL